MRRPLVACPSGQPEAARTGGAAGRPRPAYLRLLAFGFEVPSAAPQKSSICCVAVAIASFDPRAASRLIAVAAWPRAAPAALWAPLSHMLMNGFFLSQGFFREVAPSSHEYRLECSRY